MAGLQKRVEWLEKEQRFQQWLQFERFLEGLSDKQLEDIVIYCRFPEPLPEALPMGASRLDGLDRKSLNELFEESERKTINLMCEMKGRTEDEFRFHVRHDHWPGAGVPCRRMSLESALRPNENLICARRGILEQRSLSSKNEGGEGMQSFCCETWALRFSR